MIEQSKIDEIKNLIISELDPEEIILFGSYGRGDAEENSDLDFLIITPDSKKLTRRMQVDLYRKISKPRVPCDFILQPYSKFQFWKNSINHVSGRAFREGKSLYERSN